jgi:hypothetical protein
MALREGVRLLPRPVNLIPALERSGSIFRVLVRIRARTLIGVFLCVPDFAKARRYLRDLCFNHGKVISKVVRTDHDAPIAASFPKSLQCALQSNFFMPSWRKNNISSSGRC